MLLETAQEPFDSQYPYCRFHMTFWERLVTEITSEASSATSIVDYVNIRAASTTTALFWHVRDRYTLHMNSNHTGCAFSPYAGDVPSEDDFGFNQVVSGKSSCTLYNDGTPQW